MNNIEELLNQIELLKQALLFYGDEKNYENEVRYEESSLIYVDNGSQARFALKKVQETLDQNQKLQDDYNKVIGETISAPFFEGFTLNSWIILNFPRPTAPPGT